MLLVVDITSREDGSVGLFCLERFGPEALRLGHVEVLDFKMLDPITKHSVHLPQVNQLVVNTIYSYVVIFLGVGRVFQVHVESAVLCVAFSDIRFCLGADHCLKLVAIIA